MFEDGRSLPTDTSIECDVCIVGSGPAGQVIARALGESLRVVMLERGGADHAARPCDLEFASPHFASPQDTRRHQFGGMVTAWNSILPDGSAAARYLPLDPIDFDERWWVPHSGWPITFDEMTPYYVQAQQLCGIEPYDFQAPLAADGPRPPLPSPSGEMTSRLDRLGPASIFADGAMRELRATRSVRVITSAAAVELRPGTGGSTAHTMVRCGDVSFVVRSRAVVVAAGGIESARLLLNSTAFHPAGLGNQFDSLGRFYMDHPRIQLGHGSLSGGVDLRTMGLYEPHVAGRQAMIGKLKLSSEALRREEILNGNAQIFPHDLSAPQLAAVRSARVLVDAVRHRERPPTLRAHVGRVARQAVPTVWRWGSVRLRRPNNLSAAGSDNWTCSDARSFKVDYQAEQAPNRWNRVTLGEGVDELGFRVPRLQWRWSELDLRSIDRARTILRSEIAASGFGEMTEFGFDQLPRGELGGLPASAHHHLGTTRMSASAADGVVDRNCRVHGASPVYVAGGSVFPTGGYANPTLTIVALAVRLANELRRVFDVGSASVASSQR